MQIGGDNSLATDYRSFALKRAAQLGVFTAPPAIFEDNFMNVPADPGSQWQILTQIGAAGTVIGTGAPGGVIRMDSTAVASKGVNIQIGKATGTKPTFAADPTAAGSYWYLLWVFSLASAFDAQTTCVLELIRAAGAGANVVYFGFDGQFGSATNFMAEDNTAAVASSIVPGAPGTWHYLEAWQVGTTKQAFFRFDNELPKALPMTGNMSAPATILIQCANGTSAASRQLDIDHLVVLSPGNAVLPII